MKLCLNQATTMPYDLPTTARAATAAGIEFIGLWVEPVEELGTQRVRELLDETGLIPTSLSRVGFLANKQDQEYADGLAAVRRGIDICAELSIPTLSFVAGGLPAHDRSIRHAEARVRDALESVMPDAAAAGVRILLEPIHPLFVNDRSIVTTVGQALRVLDGLPSEVFGILLDSYAIFCDPELEESLVRAGAENRVGGFQINDFLLPLPSPTNMNGRLLPGDGVIDLVAMTQAVRQAGYDGPVEVEVFNDELWSRPIEDILQATVDSFERVMASATG